jgi:amidohydrolase family protein
LASLGVPYQTARRAHTWASVQLRIFTEWPAGPARVSFSAQMGRGACFDLNQGRELRVSLTLMRAPPQRGTAWEIGMAEKFVAKASEFKDGDRKIVFDGDNEIGVFRNNGQFYARDMYYSSQPIEIQNRQAMESTFAMMDAENRLLYASDYPHWDFDLPSTLYDLPFLSEKAKHNILGGTAARLFKLPPRNEKQRANLIKYGNLAA